VKGRHKGNPQYTVYRPGDKVSVPRAIPEAEVVRRWVWAAIGALVGAAMAGVALWLWLR
jgi:hypothetical protein